MPLKEDIGTYISLDTEIKRRARELKDLRQQKNDIETKIAETLDSKDMPGCKYKNIAVVLVTKNTRCRKKNVAKKEDVCKVLRYKQKTPEEMVNDIIEAMRGEISEKLSIKICPQKD